MECHEFHFKKEKFHKVQNHVNTLKLQVEGTRTPNNFPSQTEEKKYFPNNCYFVQNIKHLEVIQTYTIRWEQIDPSEFRNLETITYLFNDSEEDSAFKGKSLTITFPKYSILKNASQIFKLLTIKLEHEASTINDGMLHNQLNMSVIPECIIYVNQFEIEHGDGDENVELKTPEEFAWFEHSIQEYQNKFNTKAQFSISKPPTNTSGYNYKLSFCWKINYVYTQNERIITVFCKELRQIEPQLKYQEDYNYVKG